MEQIDLYRVEDNERDWIDEMDMIHRCDVCGHELEAVRPGKWQCNYCEEQDMLNAFCGTSPVTCDMVKRAFSEMRKTTWPIPLSEFAIMFDQLNDIDPTPTDYYPRNDCAVPDVLLVCGVVAGVVVAVVLAVGILIGILG